MAKKITDGNIKQCQLVGTGLGIAMRHIEKIIDLYDDTVKLKQIKEVLDQLGRPEPDKVVNSELPRNIVFALGTLAGLQAVAEESDRMFNDMFGEELIERAKEDAENTIKEKLGELFKEKLNG